MINAGAGFLLRRLGADNRTRILNCLMIPALRQARAIQQTYSLRKNSTLEIMVNGGLIDIPPLAGESSITFDLSGPLLVLEINDLKGQAARGPSLINPNSVGASMVKITYEQLFHIVPHTSKLIFTYYILRRWTRTRRGEDCR